jgi:hypothetical protein
MNECLHEVADFHSSLLSHAEVDGVYEQSIPVALHVLNPNVAAALREAADDDETPAQRKTDYKNVAEYIDITRTFWRACDETGIEKEDRRRMLKDVKRFFLRDVEDWCKVPSYIHGLPKGTWVQLLISIDNMLFALDDDFCAKMGVKWIHPRIFNQDAVETFFSMMSLHKTVDLFESRVAWTVYEMSKLWDPNLGFFKPVSNRKSRVACSSDDAANPHLNDQDAGRTTVKRASGGNEYKRPVTDPNRRGDRGRRRNACRERYAANECDLPHHLKELVYDIYKARNTDGRKILQETSNDHYEHLKRSGCSQADLERAVPQHTADGEAHRDWIGFRQDDPQCPAGPRPVNSSDVLIICKYKDYTYEDLNILLRYHQRKGQRKEFSELLKQIMRWGTKHEEDGCATALRYLLDGTNGWAEQVGLLRLPGEFNFIACSPDLVLHMEFPAGWKTIPLEIKCPTPMFGNKFDGRMKIKIFYKYTFK